MVDLDAFLVEQGGFFYKVIQGAEVDNRLAYHVVQGRSPRLLFAQGNKAAAFNQEPPVALCHLYIIGCIVENITHGALVTQIAQAAVPARRGLGRPAFRVFIGTAGVVRGFQDDLHARTSLDMPPPAHIKGAGIDQVRRFDVLGPVSGYQHALHARNDGQGVRGVVQHQGLGPIEQQQGLAAVPGSDVHHQFRPEEPAGNAQLHTGQAGKVLKGYGHAGTAARIESFRRDGCRRGQAGTDPLEYQVLPVTRSKLPLMLRCAHV
ncbi:MAG: hypothetical protein BWY09_01704 [Candidatus Hydrogenedentes bacterium ADurb.Bin179]|nr:MAG: hypothetical protein BWY09_01704 [Candidatus Hydrogenedentes bacterium ADurb.Bin179]